MVGCDEGKCILESLMCDGEVDCTDGTDEPITCGKKSIALLNIGERRVNETSQYLSYHGGLLSETTLRLKLL